MEWVTKFRLKSFERPFLICKSPVLLGLFLAEVSDVLLVDGAVLGHVDAELGQQRISRGGGPATEICFDVKVYHFFRSVQRQMLPGCGVLQHVCG